MKRGLAVGMTLIVALACGGLVANGPPGTLDDAGVFHEPDGYVLFGPGSACTDYDASHFLELTTSPPSCSDPGSVAGGGSNESASCEAWALDAGLTFGYLPNVECLVGKCRFPIINGKDPALHCSWGTSGADAYCTAFFQQFTVTHTAVGFCERSGDHDKCASTCSWMDPVGDADVTPTIGVATSQCEAICQ